MNTIPDSVSFSQLCSFLKAKVSQDDFAQEVALDWEDRLSEILFEFESSLDCLLYTSPSPRDMRRSRMPSSA